MGAPRRDVVVLGGSGGPLTRRVVAALEVGAEGEAERARVVVYVARERGDGGRSSGVSGAGVGGSSGSLREGGGVPLWKRGIEGDFPGPDIGDAREVFAACRENGVEHVVVISSAEVWEPSHHHVGHARETPLGADRKKLPTVGAWRALETAAREELGDAGISLTILRPAATPIPGGTDAWSRWLAGRVACPVPGHDPSVQLLDPDDLVEGVRRAVESGVEGTFHLAPAGVAPVRRAFEAAGFGWWRRWAVPTPLRRWTRAGRTGAVEQLRYPWTVSGEAARAELDFEARYDTIQTARRFGSAVGREVAEGETETFDDFGLDRGYIERKGRGLFRWVHDGYWRVELAGLEHVPRKGRAVLTGIHRGFMPFDGVMALYAIHKETGRIPRFLIHATLVKFPGLADFMTRLGGIHACRDNAARVLEDEGLLGIFPEGIRGAFCLYEDAYRFQKFGRDEYVKMALRHQAPIVPFVTLGSAEIFPIWKKLHWRWWQRVSEWPCLPITPTFPLLPVPLPSKWHTRFLAPIPVEGRYPPEAADDPVVVRELSLEVQARMRAAWDEMRAKRRSIFFGSVFPKSQALDESLEQEEIA